MENDRLKNDIRDVNIAFLALAQRLIREDPELAMQRLGIGRAVTETLSSLTAEALARIAASRILLCRFRFGEASFWSRIACAAQGASRSNESPSVAIRAAAPVVPKLAA